MRLLPEATEAFLPKLNDLVEAGSIEYDIYIYTYIIKIYFYNTFITILRKPAGRLGVVSPCERSENKEGVWGRGVVDTGAFFGRNRRCLGWRFCVSGSRLYH